MVVSELVANHWCRNLIIPLIEVTCDDCLLDQSSPVLWRGCCCVSSPHCLVWRRELSLTSSDTLMPRLSMTLTTQTTRWSGWLPVWQVSCTDSLHLIFSLLGWMCQRRSPRVHLIGRYRIIVIVPWCLQHRPRTPELIPCHSPNVLISTVVSQLVTGCCLLPTHYYASTTLPPHHCQSALICDRNCWFWLQASNTYAQS